MMSGKRYPTAFKLAAVRRITEDGDAVTEVAKQLHVSQDSLYSWLKKFGPAAIIHQTKLAEQTEMNRLRKELKRARDERDLLKKSRGLLHEAVRLRYAFIKAHQDSWPTRWLCQVLEVHPSGFYAWLKQPQSTRDKNDQRQAALIKQCWLASGGAHGYRKVHSDMRALGEQIGINRVYRLMQTHGLASKNGNRKPKPDVGKPYLFEQNRVSTKCNPHASNALLDSTKTG
jgi:putative transposase